jgi:methylated-DNA-[protein]-cysteine S-methyltransferase
MKTTHLVFENALKTPIGKINVLWTAEGIGALGFDSNWEAILKVWQAQEKKGSGASSQAASPTYSVSDLKREEKKAGVVIERLKSELSEYFSGERKSFTVPLIPARDATPFQRGVWESLKEIPYGQTISYRDQAALLGFEDATRAVGTANGKNRIAILIPCHRVLRADGTLGGYAGGLHVKEKLLKLEKAFSAPKKKSVRR